MSMVSWNAVQRPIGESVSPLRWDTAMAQALLQEYQKEREEEKERMSKLALQYKITNEGNCIFALTDGRGYEPLTTLSRNIGVDTLRLRKKGRWGDSQYKSLSNSELKFLTEKNINTVGELMDFLRVHVAVNRLDPLKDKTAAHNTATTIYGKFGGVYKALVQYNPNFISSDYRDNVILSILPVTNIILDPEMVTQEQLSSLSPDAVERVNTAAAEFIRTKVKDVVMPLIVDELETAILDQVNKREVEIMQLKAQLSKYNEVTRE